MATKVKSIIITLLFLFALYTPANATVYLNLNAEEGTVGNIVPNPPFCQTECSGSGAKGTYQSSGGTLQGSKYYQWQTVANQPTAYTEVSNSLGITNIIGKTFYVAYFFRFDRINGLDIWHETGDSADKGIEIVGSGLRWLVSRGQWGNLISNQDHRYTVWLGNPTYHLNPQLEVGDIYFPNQSGYSASNTIQLQYEQWYAGVMAIKMASDNTGSASVYIDGVKIAEYMNIRTVASSSATITHLTMNGTIAQNALDAPAHLRKFDAIILTDNWQDIVDGGYLNGGGDNTPPPSRGETSSG